MTGAEFGGGLVPNSMNKDILNRMPSSVKMLSDGIEKPGRFLSMLGRYSPKHCLSVRPVSSI